MKPIHEWTDEELKTAIEAESRQLCKTYMRRLIYKELMHRTFYPNKRIITNERRNT